MKTIHNAALVNLIGQKFHVRDLSDFSQHDEKVRAVLLSMTVDDDRWIESIVFYSDIPPEIGLAESFDDHDNVEYISSSKLRFSPASDVKTGLPSEFFNLDGSLRVALESASRHAA